MINLFPPGGVPDPDLTRHDPMKFEETQELRDSKLRHYFGDGDLPDNHGQLFIAYAEIYYSPEHLDNVAIFYDLFDWGEMREAIGAGAYPVPNVTTSNGIVAAKKVLLDNDPSY